MAELYETTGSEKEFLEKYDLTKFERPSVTADILVFTVVPKSKELKLLLIQRGNHPYMDKWALPGGFADPMESLLDTARRELMEETGVEGVYLEQLYTFSDKGRDPRGWVITTAYIAMVPFEKLNIKSGDDAKNAELVDVIRKNDSWYFQNEDIGLILQESDIAFDHYRIIDMAIERLRGKLDYTDIAFWFLPNKKNFTMPQLKAIYDTISGHEYERSYFVKTMKNRYGNRLKELGKQVHGVGKPVMHYSFK